MVTCDFRAHRVVRFRSTKRARYITKELPDVMRTTNVTFRPIDVKLGPDGALYVADWSNPIIHHGEVDFRDPRRDHEHGRIWRVTAKGRPLLTQIPNCANPELATHSINCSPRTITSATCQPHPHEKRKAILGDLQNGPQEQTTEQAGYSKRSGCINPSTSPTPAPWTNSQSEDGHIRAAGVRVLSFWRIVLKYSRSAGQLIED